jgi:hypothetical protein
VHPSDKLTLAECIYTPQFFQIYCMSLCSIFQGYYALNVYKNFGQTIETLNDDAFLTKVGSAASFLNAIRFLWSASMDQSWGSFKRIYGALLCIQIVLGATMEWAAQNKLTYAAWICLMMFTEGGHFTIIPNALKVLYGDRATEVYGIVFTYTGLSCLLIIFIVQAPFGQNYEQIFKLTALLSTVSLIVLVGFYNETLDTTAGQSLTGSSTKTFLLDSESKCQRLLHTSVDIQTEQSNCSDYEAMAVSGWNPSSGIINEDIPTLFVDSDKQTTV